MVIRASAICDRGFSAARQLMKTSFAVAASRSALAASVFA